MPEVEQFGRTLQWGVSSHPLAGETESGDLYLVQKIPEGVLMGVVDGLGHGAEAAQASQKAVAVLARHAQEPLISLVRRCHEDLRETRGVVLSVASLNVAQDVMTWIGVGNVEGILFKANSAALPNREYLFHRGGVVGYQLPSMRASVVQITRGDTLILTTDGIRPEFQEEIRLSDHPERIAADIDSQFRKESDDALILVARYL